MAAYLQSITAAGMKALFESTQNISDKEIIYHMADTLNTEYAKMASDGVGGYTVTTGLQASLEALCRRMSNAVQVEILKSFFLVLTTEFASVVTLGVSYVITTSATFALVEFADLLRQSVENLCEVRNRIMFHNLITLIQAEHVILAAADA